MYIIMYVFYINWYCLNSVYKESFENYNSSSRWRGGVIALVRMIATFFKLLNEIDLTI